MNEGYIYTGNRGMHNTYTFKEASNQKFSYNAVIMTTSYISCSTSFLPLSSCWLISIKITNACVIHLSKCPCNLLKKIKSSNLHHYVAQRSK